MNTIRKIKQKWDISLSKSYAQAFKAAVTDFELYVEKSNSIETKKPAIAGFNI